MDEIKRIPLDHLEPQPEVRSKLEAYAMTSATTSAPVVVVETAPMLAPLVGKLLAKSYRVIPDHGRSPGNAPTCILEVELATPYAGNWEWCHPMDHMRYRVEAAHVDELIKLLGL